MPTPGVVDYAAFLPTAWQERVDEEPISTWWSWRGHEVRVLRRPSARAPVRLVLVHGAGGHSAALWPVASLTLAGEVELAAIDMPLYGDTVSPDPAGVRYRDWVDLLCDFLAAEDDGRPVVLLGASIGGLLAYEAAARTGRAAAVVATCLLDPRAWRSRVVMTRFGPFGALGGLLSGLVPRPLADKRIPISWVAPLAKMSRDRRLARMCLTDRRGGGVEVPLGFLTSFMTFRHTPPELMRTPVTLAHPADDAWTPVGVSARWLRRIAAPTDLVMLRGCGHFPVEDPGLTDLVDAVHRVASGVQQRGST